MPSTSTSEVGQSATRDVGSSKQIGADDTVENIGRKILEPAECGDGRTLRYHVDTPETCDRVVKHPFHLLHLTDVGGVDDDLGCATFAALCCYSL